MLHCNLIKDDVRPRRVCTDCARLGTSEITDYRAESASMLRGAAVVQLAIETLHYFRYLVTVIPWSSPYTRDLGWETRREHATHVSTCRVLLTANTGR